MSDEKQKSDNWFDPSKKASSILDHIIDDTSIETIAHNRSQVPVEEAMHARPIIDEVTGREKSRVLFVTRDASVFESQSMLAKHLVSLSDLFDEIHVIVLVEIGKGKRKAKRVNKNIWLYTASAQYWWWGPVSARSLAKNQLTFTDGFRPDIVVSLDPFESGLAGLLIARAYKRPYQVHIASDFLTAEYKTKDKKNSWRLKMAKYVLNRTASVRVFSDAFQTKLVKQFGTFDDIALLPRHYNIKAIIDAVPAEEVESRFPQFSFKVLFVGELSHESTLYRALDAVRSILTSPRIGFIVVGDGKARETFQKRAQLLGIEKQVVFESYDTDVVSYLKSSDLLICTDTTLASEEVVVKAAAAGLPLLLARTELREDLFIDGENAFLCPADDTVCFSQKMVKFLNTNSLRTQFAKNVTDVIHNRIHEDPESYPYAFRNCIESVLDIQPSNGTIEATVAPEPEKADKVSGAPATQKPAEPTPPTPPPKESPTDKPSQVS